MANFWRQTNQLIEAFCNFAFAIIAFFIVLLPLKPALDLLKGRTGIGWVLLTIVVMGGLYLAVRLLIEPALEALDSIRRQELLRSALAPIRNISAVIGIFGVLKLEYFLVHGRSSDATATSWGEVIWEFVTKL